MPFVTIRATASGRGTVYERDYNPETIFGAAVRVKASNLVNLGFFHEGDEYCALITPLFGDGTNGNDLVWDVPDEPYKRGPGWLVLEADKDVAHRPITGFTLNLTRVKPGAKSYKKTFGLADLDYRTKQERETLEALGVVRSDEAVQIEYLVSGGDTMRAREIINMPDDLASLGSGLIVEAKAPAAHFEDKPMPRCNCGHSGNDPTQSLEVFFRANEFVRLRDYVSTHGTRSRESGGILVGEVYRDPEKQQLYVEVEDFIPGEGTEADAVSLRFTHESWQKLMDRKRTSFGDRKPVVGWYHTHPPLGITIDDKPAETVNYFCETIATCTRPSFGSRGRSRW